MGSQTTKQNTSKTTPSKKIVLISIKGKTKEEFIKEAIRLHKEAGFLKK